MREIAKSLVALLPGSSQRWLRQWHFRRQFRRGSFDAGEPEFDRLCDWIREGDCVLDVGANVGQYTARMARLVGPSGRVFAFEPVPETFAVLTSNLSSIGVRNVTLMNCAVSSESNVVAMAIPYFSTGLKNYYEAKIDDSALGPPIYSLRLDALQLPAEVSLIKIDVEGHEMLALSGMLELIERDRPRLIIEDAVREIREQLEEMGYEHEHLPGSANRVFTYVGRR